MVVNRDSQHLFGGILPNDILIQPRLDLGGGQDIDALERVIVIVRTGLRVCAAAVPRHTGARRGRALAVLVQGIVAHIQAVLADIDAGADDHLLYLILCLPQKLQTSSRPFPSLPELFAICHVVPPNSVFIGMSSIRPYSFASCAVI